MRAVGGLELTTDGGGKAFQPSLRRHAWSEFRRSRVAD